MAMLARLVRALLLSLPRLDHAIDQAMMRISNANVAGLGYRTNRRRRNRRDDSLDLRHGGDEGVCHFTAAVISGSQEKGVRIRFEQSHDLDVIVPEILVSRENDPASRTYFGHPRCVVCVLVKVVGLQLNVLADRAQGIRDRLQAQALVNEENQVTRLL